MLGDKTRTDALALLQEYTRSESLLKHALSVEAALRWYARENGEDGELWGATGLLHDFDYEQYPTYSLDGPEPTGHPFTGCKILKEHGYPQIMIDAISATPRTPVLLGKRRSPRHFLHVTSSAVW